MFKNSISTFIRELKNINKNEWLITDVDDLVVDDSHHYMIRNNDQRNEETSDLLRFRTYNRQAFVNSLDQIKTITKKNPSVEVAFHKSFTFL